jgi:chromosome segregation ATPase
MRAGFLDFFLGSSSESLPSLGVLRSTIRSSCEPLGVLALRHGLIEPGQIHAILDRQMEDERPFGQIATEMGALSADALGALLQLQSVREALRATEVLSASGLVAVEETVPSFSIFLAGEEVLDKLDEANSELAALREQARTREGEAEAEVSRLREELERAQEESRRAAEALVGSNAQFQRIIKSLGKRLEESQRTVAQRGEELDRVRREKAAAEAELASTRVLAGEQARELEKLERDLAEVRCECTEALRMERSVQRYADRREVELRRARDLLGRIRQTLTAENAASPNESGGSSGSSGSSGSNGRA